MRTELWKGEARVEQRSFISNRKVLRSERQIRRETRGSRIWSFQREGILMYSVTKQSLPRTTNVWSYFHCVYSGQSLTPAVSLEIGQPFKNKGLSAGSREVLPLPNRVTVGRLRILYPLCASVILPENGDDK